MSAVGSRPFLTCMLVLLHALPVRSRVAGRWRICKESSATPRAKTAGNWLNTPERLAPMGCNVCFPARSGIQMACAMICARTLLPHLGNNSAIVVIDETSFPKQGEKSAGVGVQYCGTTGEARELSGGRLSLVCDSQRAYADFPRTLPAPGLDRGPCSVSSGWYRHPSVRFQTKPELARRMLARLWDAQVPIAWVVADTVYGSNLDLRAWLEDRGYPYVLAVACNEPVGIVTPDGVRRRVEAAQVETFLLHTQDWQRLSMSEGTKGPRLFDWACESWV